MEYYTYIKKNIRREGVIRRVPELHGNRTLLLVFASVPVLINLTRCSKNKTPEGLRLTKAHLGSLSLVDVSDLIGSVGRDADRSPFGGFLSHHMII